MGRAVSRRARTAGDLARPRLSHALTAALIAPGAALLLAAAPAHAGSVDVTVTNVRSALGHVRVAICTKEYFLNKTCQIRQQVPSVVGTTVLHFDNVPPGEYAAEGYLDEHDWGEVRRDALGFPENDVGFSNDAPIRFGPPKWDDARFSVGDGVTQVHVTLHHFAL